MVPAVQRTLITPTSAKVKSGVATMSTAAANREWLPSTDKYLFLCSEAHSSERLFLERSVIAQSGAQWHTIILYLGTLYALDIYVILEWIHTSYNCIVFKLFRKGKSSVEFLFHGTLTP